MKKTLLVVLCVVLCVALFACSAPAATDDTATDDTATEEPATDDAADDTAADDTADAATGDGPLVGISTPDNPTGWVGAVQWCAQNKAEELGLNFKLVTAPDANDQANDIEELISLGCEYIILFPQNDELAVAAQKVKDAGITLINFDRTLGATEPDYYVAGDNFGMGVAGGEYICEKLGEEGGKVVIMNIPNYGAIFTERVDGFKSVAAEHPELEIVGEYASDDGAPETVLPVMADVLTANPQIDAIYSTDDEMSQGILQAIKEAGREDIKVVTGGGGAQSYFKLFDQYPNIWASSQTYSPYMMNDVVQLCADLISGAKEYEQTTIIPTENVDRENYKEYMEKNGITEDAPY